MQITDSLSNPTRIGVKFQDFQIFLQGFIVFDFAKRYKEAAKALGHWNASGLLRLREDVRDGGVDAFPEMLNRLYSGEKLGKLVLRL